MQVHIREERIERQRAVETTKCLFRTTGIVKHQSKDAALREANQALALGPNYPEVRNGQEDILG